MMASGVHAGELDRAAVLDTRDRDGVRFGDALEAIGFRGEEPVGERRFAAFLELHIEQGPVLEAAGETVGVVTGAQGVAWWNGDIAGRDSHAGTTPMPMRKDALVGLAELALACDRIAREHGPAGVCTIGQAEVLPGSRNTIPGHVRCQGDSRHPDAAALTAMVAALHQAAREIAERRNLAIEIEQIWRKDPVVFDTRCVAAVDAAAAATGLPFRRMLSGAGHDACYLASTCPTSMIFVPCKDGISHNEEEWAEPEACAAGAQVLLGAVLDLDADPPRG
jgi:N-carbamoyl-L-amino-acid hydrolase